MRRSLSFKIEGFDKAIEVRELNMNEILSMFSMSGLDKIETWSDILGHVQGEVLPLLTNLTSDEILSFAPSELEIVYNKVKEVNKVFFGLTRAPMVTRLLEEIKPKILGAFGDSYADLSKLGTLTPEAMDTLISSMQSTKTNVSNPKE